MFETQKHSFARSQYLDYGSAACSSLVCYCLRMLSIVCPRCVMVCSRFVARAFLFLFIVLKTVLGGKKATPQVWEGARGLEWSVESPAPYHTFSTPPKVN